MSQSTTKDEELICYCVDCAMQHRLPLRQPGIVGGYCQICGDGSLFVGAVTIGKIKELKIDSEYLQAISKRQRRKKV